MNSKEAIEKRLDLLWEQNKQNSRKSELGTYIDVDNLSIRDTGLSKEDLSSPGNFNSWRNNASSGRYFLERFGAGRTRMFRR